VYAREGGEREKEREREREREVISKWWSGRGGRGK
jgi:hypothetical protein